MLKAEQIPYQAHNAAMKAYDETGNMSLAIIAAINAWPGAEPLRRRYKNGKGVFLPPAAGAER